MCNNNVVDAINRVGEYKELIGEVENQIQSYCDTVNFSERLIKELSNSRSSSSVEKAKNSLDLFITNVCTLEEFRNNFVDALVQDGDVDMWSGALINQMLKVWDVSDKTKLALQQLVEE